MEGSDGVGRLFDKVLSLSQRGNMGREVDNMDRVGEELNSEEVEVLLLVVLSPNVSGLLSETCAGAGEE